MALRSNPKWVAAAVVGGAALVIAAIVVVTSLNRHPASQQVVVVPPPSTQAPSTVVASTAPTTLPALGLVTTPETVLPPVTVPTTLPAIAGGTGGGAGTSTTSTTTGPPQPCAADDLSVTAGTDQTAYGPGQPVVVSLGLTDVGTSPCIENRPAGWAGVVIEIDGSVVWGADLPPGAPSGGVTPTIPPTTTSTSSTSSSTSTTSTTSTTVVLAPGSTQPLPPLVLQPNQPVSAGTAVWGQYQCGTPCGDSGPGVGPGTYELIGGVEATDGPARSLTVTFQIDSTAPTTTVTPGTSGPANTAPGAGA